MGCVSSRRDINDIHPNVFQVMNVDEHGQHVSPGQLELTEAELVLYQHGKATTRWPLRCLRRYGFDAEIFSFESGRRCPTGPGIYAFRCRRAEQLFNLLQQNIQLRNLSDELVSVATEVVAVPAATSGPPVCAREPALTRGSTTRFSRPGSVASNGPASPPSASSPTPLTSESATAAAAAAGEHNNNKRSQHSYSNTATAHGDPDSSTTQPYANLEPTSSPTLSSSSEPYAQLNLDSDAECCHVYMNVTPGEQPKAAAGAFESAALLECDEEREEPRHCYANLNPSEADQGRPEGASELLRKVNYIVLDLEAARGDQGTLAPPDSPRRLAKGYATIDFNKTVALSHSVNPSLELDSEGSRKTRHNSTIGELARHTSSLTD